MRPYIVPLLTLLSPGESFVVPIPFLKSRSSVLLLAQSDAEVGKKVAAAFGSAAQELTKQASAKINELTGKDEYDIGDLTKLLDQKARAAVSDLTNKEEADFGDLINLVEGKVKDVAADLETKEEWNQLKELSKTAGSGVQERLSALMDNKDMEDFAQVQEVATKEIVELIKSREYGIGDLFFLLKLCTSFGLGMNPAVMAIFPLNVLVQLYNFSLIQEAGNRVTAAVALELDKRARNALALEMDKQAKIAVFGDENAEVGAVMKKAVLDSINKSEFALGDITRNLLDALDDDTDTPAPKPIGVADEAGDVVVLDAELVEDLEALDKALDQPIE